MPPAKRKRLLDGPGYTRPAPVAPANQPMTREEEEQWADEMPLNYLICRTKKHADKLIDVSPVGRGCVMYYRCVNCRRELRETLDARGFVTDRKLEYPKKYLAPKGAGRTTQNRNALLRIRRAYRFMEGKK